MARQHHYRRRSKEAPDLDMTTFLNLMVVLVPFLLITAVFSRITIVELSLPSAAGGAPESGPSFRVEVIVRDDGLELRGGNAVVASLPKVGDHYDLERLSDHLVALKGSHPEQDDASVLLEPNIEYDHLIQVMDVVRNRERAVAGDGEVQRLALFTDISIGDAP